jgi:pilus assembly protein Flp/PilA
MTAAMMFIRSWLAPAGDDRDSERGASLVEYALLVALIAIVCIVAVGFLGETASSSYEDMGNSLAGAN